MGLMRQQQGMASARLKLKTLNDNPYIIKKVMTNLAEIAKTTFQTIGNWLVYVASRIARFNDWELNRAERGVKKVADGEYDWRIDRIDRGRGGGISR